MEAFKKERLRCEKNSKQSVVQHLFFHITIITLLPFFIEMLQYDWL
jgi:ABC-type transport system involved in cytochrome c biogenesis permease component